MRRFQLHRDRDVSGVSGTGVVAVGTQYMVDANVEFLDGFRLELPAGWCRVTWLTEFSSTVLWRSVEDAMAVHGHGGATRLVWLDDAGGEQQ